MQSMLFARIFPLPFLPLFLLLAFPPLATGLPPPIEEHFRHSLLLNKFLYQLHDQKDLGEGAQSSSSPSIGPGSSPGSLLFPLHRTATGFRHPLMGLPPALVAPSNGLLLPTPAQLPSTFRLPATAMAQHKAFPMDGPRVHSSPLLILSTVVDPGEKLAKLRNATEKEENGQESSKSNEIGVTSESPASPQIISSTTESPTSASTSPPSPSPSPSTSLPSASSPSQTVANANGLNSSTTLDVESFLRSANLSSEHTAEFMRLLEAEVARRLAIRGENKSVEEKPRAAGSRRVFLELPLEEAEAEVRRAEQELQAEEEREAAGSNLGRTRRLELKTANTRLFSLASGEANEQQQQQQERRVVPTPSEKAAVTKEDYRQREQAEFDRLLGQLAEESRPGGGQKPIASRERVEGDGDDLLLVVQAGGSRTAPIWAANSTSTASSSSSTTQQRAETTTIRPQSAADLAQDGQQGEAAANAWPLNRQQRFWSRHGPKNKFERLVEDYRFRLGGQDGPNGLNDLVKALQNAHIGFFDRTDNGQTIKILRRIDRK